ncbi:putative methyltransferase PMT25, partial [Zea mays]
MAFGRGGKMDGRRPSSSSSSSSFCTTTTVVLFVALCLVGAWMMTSSTVFPLEISSNKKPVVKQQPAPVNFGASQEASPGIAGEGSEKFEDTDNNDATVPEEPNKQDASEQENFNEKPEEKELEVPVEKAETKDMFDDANGKSEGLSDETKNDDGEKSVEKKDNEITNESGDEKTDGESKDGQEEKPDGDAAQEEQPKIEEN